MLMRIAIVIGLVVFSVSCSMSIGGLMRPKPCPDKPGSIIATFNCGGRP